MVSVNLKARSIVTINDSGWKAIPQSLLDIFKLSWLICQLIRLNIKYLQSCKFHQLPVEVE